MEDVELLRRYVEQASHEAFAELVRRHLAMVYSSAVRQVRDRHRAEDVAQAVFVALARDARRVRRGERLSGWLLATTRHLASHDRQRESRRRHHETAAASMVKTMTDPPTTDVRAWEQVAPALDEAMSRLSKASRDALLLRYFEGKAVREVAEALQISEDAAKQRLSRAVEQLRGFFRRRGVMVSTTALAALLASNAVQAQAVPAGLAASAAAVSLKSAAAAATRKGAWAMLTGMNAKVAAGVVAVVTAGGLSAVAARQAFHRESRPVAARPVALALAADDWRERFEQTYAPADGEFVKRVPPPFIPEREAYFNEIDPKRVFDTSSDGIFTFTYEGKVEFSAWQLGRPTLAKVLGQCAGIPGYRLEAPLKDKLRPVTGDWVIRPGATEDQKVAAIEKVLRQQLKWDVRLEKKKVEREVVVARGRYAFKALPQAADADDRAAGLAGLVHLYVDGLSGERGAAAGDVGRFLTSVGEMMQTEVVNEAQAEKATVFWRNHVGSSVPRENADKLLDNLSKQTGLRFAREKRMTDRWFLVTPGA